MYCCSQCNVRKGDLAPPAGAIAKGLRFYRPDEDKRADHFLLVGRRLEPRTPVGEFSIEMLDLNRHTLLRVRELRERLHDCHAMVAEGVLGLRRSRIDRLPPKVRGRAVNEIGEIVAFGEELATKIDDLLRQFARSDLIDPDPESEQRAERRAKYYAETKALTPGRWRGRQAGRSPLLSRAGRAVVGAVWELLPGFGQATAAPQGVALAPPLQLFGHQARRSSES